MDRFLPTTGNFSLRSSFCVAAAAAAAICFLGALWTVQSNTGRILRRSKKAESSLKKRSCDCSCSCSSSSGCGSDARYANGIMGAEYEMEVGIDRQTGASMMEQLVPEITTHALSYLDYSSLCSLSMTNSSMRRAANDDSPWKALYHKDFTVEQDSVTPLNGWKSYYAATKAIVNINAEFYNIIKERSLPAMSRFWLRADYVKCVHASGELFAGYNAVMESWALAFNWGQIVTFQLRDVCARVLTDVAWVTMKVYVNIESGPFHVTNVYEFHDGRWYMVHHRSSVILNGGEVEHANIFG